MSEIYGKGLDDAKKEKGKTKDVASVGGGVVLGVGGRPFARAEDVQ